MDTTTPEVKKPFYKKKWFLILMVILVIGALADDSTPETKMVSSNSEVKDTVPEPKEEEIEEAVLEVSSTKLIADYKANEISADATYKDKQVKVTGVVGSIAKDIMDNPYVTLTDEIEYSFESVQCFFNKANEAELANVVKDTRITVQGRITGKSLTNVIMKDCTLVK